MEFHSQHHHLFNNQDIERRKLANVLFLIIQGKEKESNEIWKSDRNLDKKVFLRAIDKSTEWKIDVYNQKLLFIDRVGDQIKVSSVDWVDNKNNSDNS